MANHRIAPELRERAIMHMMPPYNWSLRQVADDIGVGIATVHGWRKQLELEGLIIRKIEPDSEHSTEQIFTILLETVIPPFFGALKSRGHAACAKRCFGV